MSESKDVPLLAAPEAVPDDEHVAEGPEGDEAEQGASGEAERKADPARPEAAANNYRFAGLVTLIPEDSASVDRLA
ncbi:hypothetical protein [Citreimonas sp.]|uniref:hypothetical protein n=1 Tax=Citreimonas sp. TaxID=3036715 RepID=UPI004059198B